ncbi:hypothetical protein FIBSPDRAFT_960011 [Athelia psychrophila]|uniref:Uncharacterized protein n=1 Tax=Athelia psychrophila TaxID=1759441 RepID=A0A166CWF8_9AGAM|nr:hypothetical protein FIBSPDRAFT_960011 [Fibularhizoctonia sp. CBS 109695]
MHIAPKLRSSTSNHLQNPQSAVSNHALRLASNVPASAPVYASPSKVLRVLPASLLDVAAGIAYTHPEQLACSCRRRRPTRPISSTYHPASPWRSARPIPDPSEKAGTTMVLAEWNGEKGGEVLSGCRVGTPAGRDILLFAPDGKAGEWDLSLTHVAATTEREPSSKVISGADVARSLPSTLARHDETPVPTLKGVFKHWWGTAAWHCSSVIAFDKVAKVPGVELEVCFFILPLYVLSLPR